LLAGPSVFFILLVHGLKLLSPALEETWAFIGAHQRPLSVSLHSLHEEIWDPEGIEEVTSAILLSAIILTQLQELVDIRMPWLKVDSEGALTLTTALVHISGCIIEDLEHGHESI